MMLEFYDKTHNRTLLETIDKLEINVNKSAIKASSKKAILFHLKGWDCWIPKSMTQTRGNHIVVIAGVSRNFKLQKYKPQLDKEVTMTELVELMQKKVKRKPVNINDEKQDWGSWLDDESPLAQKIVSWDRMEN